MNGQGLLIWIDGKKYKGEFVNDKLNGKGKITYTDGLVEEGDF